EEQPGLHELHRKAAGGVLLVRCSPIIESRPRPSVSRGTCYLSYVRRDRDQPAGPAESGNAAIQSRPTAFVRLYNASTSTSARVCGSARMPLTSQPMASANASAVVPCSAIRSATRLAMSPKLI